MMGRDSVAEGDMAYLRDESLRVVLVCLFAGLWVWSVILFFTHDRFGPIWWGLVVLVVALLLAFLRRDRSTLFAAWVVVSGLAVAILHGMWLVDGTLVPFMLAVVVSLTGLLFSLKAVAWVTAACVGVVLGMGTLRWHHPFLSADVVSPALVIGAVGFLSSLTVRNVYEALYWFRDRAEAAQRNEEELREQRGQLVRTLKALDEAYGRLEYLNYDLVRAREAAEKARLNRQQFAANVSHELRTPLNVVMALSETMYHLPERYHDGPPSPSFRGDAHELYRSSRHLLRLIGDVLDMSQIEAGQMRLDVEPVQLDGVVREALDMIRPLVPESDVALRADVPTDLPSVLIDRTRIQQVLLNLLNNARRFTERGSITVRAVCEGDVVWVTVADTGVGIPPREHERMFKEFQQIDVSGTGRQDGSGLGLAISKRFIEMHGGRIWVESDGVPGRGTRFHFTLPVAGAETVELSALQNARVPVHTPPTGRGRTLLLLDSDPAIQRQLEQGLEEYRVTSTQDPGAVREMAGRLGARAVVVNLAQGHQARRKLQQLREHSGSSSLPVILCSLVGQHQLGEAMGAFDYLVKPVTREALTALLDRLDERVRRVLVIDDDPQMVRLLSRMLEMSGRGYEVTRACGGEAGLRQMRATCPDLVLLDLVMPDVDGHEVLERMREDAELHDIPVVVVTAQTHTPEEERQLGGKTVCVSVEGGFTNQEVIRYVGGILQAVPL